MKDKNIKEFFDEIVPDTNLENKTLQKIEQSTTKSTVKLKVLRISIISFTLFLITLFITLSSIRINVTPTSLDMQNFSSHADFQNYVTKKNSEFSAFRNSINYNPFSSCGVGCSSSDNSNTTPPNEGISSSTNLQVEGVDEADTVKNNSRFIYTVLSKQEENKGAINIFDTLNQNIGKIEIEEFAPKQIFLTNNTLTVLGTHERYLTKEERKNARYYSDKEVSSYVRIFDVSEPFSAKVISTYGYPTNTIVSARIISNTLFLIMQSQKISYQNEVVIPSFFVNGEKQLVAPQNLYAQTSNASVYVYTNIATISIPSGTLKDVKTFFAAADIVYASKDALYTSSSYYEYSRNLIGGTFFKKQQIAINRFILSENGVTFHSSILNDGFLVNQFAMDEYDGYFRVATTLSDGEGAMVTLYKINETNLNKVSFVAGMGKENNERIYSVRFQGDLCYLVTARNTDPLYIIDLKDKQKPKVMSELKIPDVSEYMHAFDDNTIIGIGRQENEFGFRGLQTTLFDVTDKYNPKKIDQILFDKNSNSPILENHKALLYLKSSENIAFYGFPIYSDFITFFPIISTDGSSLKLLGKVAVASFTDSTRGIIIGENIFIVSPQNISLSSFIKSEDSSITLAPTNVIMFD